jgi:hypothetical protein
MQHAAVLVNVVFNSPAASNEKYISVVLVL